MAGLGPRPRTIRPPEPRFTIRDLLLGAGPPRVLARLFGRSNRHPRRA
jgi:hypothetical protein